MTASVFVVVNPYAGNGRGRVVWGEVRQRLSDLGTPFEFELTQGELTAESFARQALLRGAETVVVVGGDGTINEAVNGFFLNDQPVRPGARLAIVPAGSSSDTARGLGIPDGVAALDLLQAGQTFQIDLGRAEFSEQGRTTSRYFVNNADVGIGGRIATGAGPFKFLGGRLAFFASSLKALADPQPWSGRIQLDEHPPEPIQAVSVAVALGPYTGGGMKIAPRAKWDDGCFEIVVIGGMSRGELLRSFPRVYAGTHLSHPGVRSYQAREVSVQAADSPLIELDGEVVGAGDVRFRILPSALGVCVPRP